MAKILLVEDDETLAQQLKAWLEYERYIVEVASAGDEALDRLKHYHFDLVILDWTLPGMEGIEVCRRLRERGQKLPVLMLSGRDTLADRTSGLDGGADDYVTKPVSPKELSARIRALMRRQLEAAEAPLEIGDLYLSASSLTVRKGGADIALQPKEMQLLELFMRHPNQILATEFIIEKVWSTDSQANANLVKSYVNKLRSKFEHCEKPLNIKAVYGQGYIFSI
jgi:two-component system response regulator MprA